MRGVGEEVEDEHVGREWSGQWGVLLGSTKALVSKPPEVYIPLLETGTGASEGFGSNKTQGCIEGTEISNNEDCKLKINSNLNNWNNLRPLEEGE